MRAVNLIPAEERAASRGLGVKLAPPTMGLFGVLAAAIILVTLYVLAGNTVAERQAQLETAQAELTRTQSAAGQLQSYTQFATLAATRVQTVRAIAATRFDWTSALENLARVVPADTSLQSLDGTVVPGAAAGSGSSGAASLRGDLQGPAFALNGCTGSQVEVAQLISRLRAMPGVVRVALGSSEKSGAASAGGSAGGSSGAGCAAPGAATFNLVVFFTPLTGAGASGVTTLAGAPARAGAVPTAVPTTLTATGGAK